MTHEEVKAYWERTTLREHLETQVKGHECATCGKPLWVAFQETYFVRCLCYPADPVWRRQESSLTRRRREMATQTGIVKWEPQNLLARLKEAENAKLFPADAKFNAEMRLVFAQVAVLYQLDPLMREIMPYQGQIYITLDGRRKLDDRAGRKASFRFEPLSKAELQAYIDTAGWDDRDVGAKCIATELDGRVVDRVARVKASERKRDTHLPTVQWPWEMACGRAERFCRRVLWGSVETPVQLGHGIAVDVVEGEPGVVIEPPATIVPPENPAAPLYERPQEARSAPPAPVPAQTPAQPAATPQRASPEPARGSAITCSGHSGAAMFPVGKRSDNRFGHKLADGTLCYGIPAASPPVEGEGQGEGDDTDDLPPSQAEDLEDLQSAVAAQGMEWEYFVTAILRCHSWEEWVSLGGTVAAAWERGGL